jgi:hypothetical protein
LEQALIKLLNFLTVKSPLTYIFLATLKQTLESLGLNSNFIQFIKLSISFKFQHLNGGWQVALSKLSIKSINSDLIEKFACISLLLTFAGNFLHYENLP